MAPKKTGDKIDALKKKTLQVKKKAKKPIVRRKTLAYGVVKFRATLSHGKWLFVKKSDIEKRKAKKEAQNADPKIAKRKITIRRRRVPIINKPIQGEKNGGTRDIHLKRKNYYAVTKRPVKHIARSFFSKHKRFIRSSLTPGTVLILLCGVNKGKRVILLKTLDSGLLLVTGPFLLNGVPVRRVHPGHVIGTKTKLDISSVELPEKLQDKYFARAVEKKKVKKGEKTIFVPKKKVYKPDEDRKEIQKAVDKQVLTVIKKHPLKKVLFAYLSSMFGLRNNQYPHRLQF